MLLDIVNYGDPVLRQKGERVEQITPEITQLIDDMLETMHEAHGIGLAAQQVGKALQLTMVDVTDVEDRPSRMSIDGEAVKPED
ncbi:MAG: peptide deformylase, partial [Verrucomicrobia bacterium]|nr:peptide deformylase [Verrucomicrobiota bacterium]